MSEEEDSSRDGDGFSPADEEVSKWDDYYRELPELEEDAALHGFNVELVDLVRVLLPSGGRILEAGAGGGWQSLALSRAGFEVSLLDVSEEALGYARRNFQRHGAGATFELGSIFDPGDESYDLVFNLGAVEHYELEEQARFVRGMAERSRRFVLAVVPNRKCYWYWLWRIWRTEVDRWPFGREVPRGSLEETFERAGVDLVGHRWLGATWTEGLVAEIPGLDDDLRQRILRIHRTPLVPPQQRCYLTAALGVVDEGGRPVPGGWRGLEGHSGEAKVGALASSLAEELARAERTRSRYSIAPRGRDGVYGKEAVAENEVSRSAATLEERFEVAVNEARIARSEIDTYRESLERERRRRREVESELGDLRRTLELLRAQQASLEEEKHALASQVASVRQRELQLRGDLAEIHASKLWRAADFYWTIRRGLRRVFRSAVRRLTDSKLLFRRWWSRIGETLVRRKSPELPRVELTQYDILVFPVIDWDFRFQRPQQLASQFAENGHRVFYLQTTFGGHDEQIVSKEIQPRIYNLKMPGPETLRIYTSESSQNLVEEWLEALAQFRHEAALEQAALMVQLPFWEPLAVAARERWGWKIVYDCMDDHGGFSTNSDKMLANEENLIHGADLVLTTSQVLYERIAPSAKRSLLLRNAADFDHFNAAAAGLPRKDSDGPSIIGYFGAISEWFDADAVEFAASARRDWRFVLIGDTFGADVSGLEELPNVDLLGELPYDKLPGYLKRFDVALLPFKRTPLTEATNPVKFYEYLAAGKPVVARALPELIPFSDLFYPFSTPEEMVGRIEDALNEDPEAHRRDRIETARANTWRARYEVLDREIQNLYGKAAIVIVSFNNLDYLKLCLESLWAQTVYPRFEVIVVDNDSAPEVRRYLQEAGDKRSRLQVIFNEENLGFPRANNIGIQSSGECEYIILLNDDTVVTRGWLSRLLHHLDRPGTELVGPVTNFCGNEARIPVDYKTINEMEEFARRYTAQHEGETSELDMLAMYCIAMRRSLLDRIGLLDERFGIGMFEDDDFSRRIKEDGGRIVCAEDVFVHHWGRSSFGRMQEEEYEKLFEENRRKFEEKWGTPWKPHEARDS